MSATNPARRLRPWLQVCRIIDHAFDVYVDRLVLTERSQQTLSNLPDVAHVGLRDRWTRRKVTYQSNVWNQQRVYQCANLLHLLLSVVREKPYVRSRRVDFSHGSTHYVAIIQKICLLLLKLRYHHRKKHVNAAEHCYTMKLSIEHQVLRSYRITEAIRVGGRYYM